MPKPTPRARPHLANPGQDGLGTLQQNMLEASNVEPVQELIDMITTQRAFELNSQAIKTGDRTFTERGEFAIGRNPVGRSVMRPRLNGTFVIT